MRMAGIPDSRPLAFGGSFDRRPLEEDFDALDLAHHVRRPDVCRARVQPPRAEESGF